MVLSLNCYRVLKWKIKNYCLKQTCSLYASGSTGLHEVTLRGLDPLPSSMLIQLCRGILNSIRQSWLKGCVGLALVLGASSAHSACNHCHRHRFCFPLPPPFLFLSLRVRLPQGHHFVTSAYCLLCSSTFFPFSPESSPAVASGRVPVH